jgi:hypothetical protein
MLAIIAGVLLVAWLLGFTAFHVTTGFTTSYWFLH